MLQEKKNEILEELEKQFFPMNDFTGRPWYIDLTGKEVITFRDEVKSYVSTSLDTISKLAAEETAKAIIPSKVKPITNSIGEEDEALGFNSAVYQINRAWEEFKKTI